MLKRFFNNTQHNILPFKRQMFLASRAHTLKKLLLCPATTIPQPKAEKYFYKTIVAEVHGAKRISSSLVHTESDFLEYLDSLPLECPNVICGLHNWPELLKNKSLMGWYTLPFKYLGLVIF